MTRPRAIHRTPRPRLAAFAGIVACSALLASASVAQAETQLGLDLDTVVPIDSRAESGGGFAARLGWQLHLPLLTLTPEAVFAYAGFTGSYGPEVYRMLAGVRVGIGEVFRFGALGHVGLGRLSAGVPGPDPSRTALSYDLGLFLDFTLIPLLNLGVHGKYDGFPATDDDPVFQWLTFGLHAELIF